MEKAVINSADKVICITPELTTAMNQKYILNDKNKNKILTNYAGFDPKDFPKRQRRRGTC